MNVASKRWEVIEQDGPERRGNSRIENGECASMSRTKATLLSVLLG